MARTPKSDPKPTGTAVANWDEQLAKEADVAAGMEQNSGGGQFFSFKSGVMSFDGNIMPGNQMAVVIVDTIYENVFYEGRYDPDNPAPPTCFAFGRDEDTMAPHDTVFKADQQQSDICKTCPNNEWGSADTGKGKACRNTRRLAVIPAGTFDKNGNFQPVDDDEHYTTANIAYMKLPVTSIRGYAGFVKQVAGVLRRPPHGIFTRVFLTPDAKTQFKVNFEALGPIPNELMGAVFARNAEAKTLIEFPYSLEKDEREPAPAAKGRGAKVEKPARGRKY